MSAKNPNKPVSAKRARELKLKPTGAYYTPDELVDCLLDGTVDKAIEERTLEADPIAALLDLKLCDPSVGAGQFPLRAARRIALRVAQLRCATHGEPPEDAYRLALRDVVGRCLYCVDINPFALELCKLALWMDSAVEGMPLSFLDHHIQHGDSVIGATPKSMAEGIPDKAWEALTGDDKAVARELKKRNRQEREARERELAAPTGEAQERPKGGRRGRRAADR